MRKALAPCLLGLLALVQLAACSAIDRSVGLAEAVVVPVTTGDATDVAAIDLAQAMLRAGFTKEEIVRHGPALHSALATSGSAQVRQNKVVAAVFAVHTDKLYVVSRTRGTFMQPLGQSEADPSMQASAE